MLEQPLLLGVSRERKLQPRSRVQMVQWDYLTSSCSRSSVGELEESPAPPPYLVSRLELSFARVWLTESASSWN